MTSPRPNPLALAQVRSLAEAHEVASHGVDHLCSLISGLVIDYPEHLSVVGRVLRPGRPPTGGSFPDAELVFVIIAQDGDVGKIVGPSGSLYRSLGLLVRVACSRYKIDGGCHDRVLDRESDEAIRLLAGG